ncbi:exosortase H [Gilvimarinus sp. SDUM040013]|uniref:exosortase H n=1 Tax=Gilvimarinus gilvus TaxID=3058038 RepID=UPI002673FD57|nr:exosortase H [Gilvimarinus sp. SDUM040013]MDO3388102.1 exosortase H [Gilvimarinus sp. SDUM040013]
MLALSSSLLIIIINLSASGTNVFRFFLKFFLVMVALFVLELTPPGQKYVVEPLTSGLAQASAFFIQLFGRELAVQGIVMVDRLTGFAVQIAAGCNGIEAMILLVAAIVAFPAPWRYRLVGLVFGLVSVQALNLVRIVSLFYLGIWHKPSFEWAHLYIWQALIMLDTLLVWMLWIRYIPKTRKPDGDSKPPAGGASLAAG